jgi:hypothetical protein
MRFLSAILSLVSLFAFVSNAAFAGPLNSSQLPTITVSIPGSQGWSHTPSVEAYRPATDQDGGYELFGSQREFVILDQRATVEIQELQFNPDPFVLNNILVTNTTAMTQTFSAFVGLPTTFGAPNLISGLVRTSVIDGGLDGATVATLAGTPLYQAQIDGTTVATLQNSPFSLSAPVGGSDTAAATFGPNASNMPVNTQIGIQLTFTLTPGDTASILSRFDVVPEPASAAMVVIGLAIMASVCRRYGRR